MTEQAHPEWDTSYTADTPAPWDIGRPQPTFVRLADEGRLTGRLLDAGCGTGENALLAASRGADVTGIDLAPTAIARARAKASERGLTARFEVADTLGLGRLNLTVDTVIDSGVFHVFGDHDRARYVASLAAVLRPVPSLAGKEDIRLWRRRRRRRKCGDRAQQGGWGSHEYRLLPRFEVRQRRQGR
jgi:SAM-dependent methyltransferase